MPMTTSEAATSTATLSRGKIDDIAVIAAVYWLLLAGVALRRTKRRDYAVIHPGPAHDEPAQLGRLQRAVLTSVLADHHV